MIQSKESKTISIIILSKTTDESSFNLLEETLFSLQKSQTWCKHKIKEIVVVENSTKEFKVQSIIPIKFINNTNEFNYNRFLNYGVEQLKHKTDYIAVCNNDLIFHTTWLSILDYDYPSMSPKCSLTQSQKHFTKPTMGYRTAQELAGWCIILKPEVWKQIKGFDESVSFWASDDCYREQLLEHNIEHWIIPECRVDHVGVGSNTLKNLPQEEKKKLTFDQVKIYNEKYNKKLFGK